MPMWLGNTSETSQMPPCLVAGDFFVVTFSPSGFAPEGLSVLPSGFCPAAFLSLRFPLVRVGAGSCEQPKRAKTNPKKGNPMNTDELSTGGGSPSATLKKREGEKRKSPLTPLREKGKGKEDKPGAYRTGLFARADAHVRGALLRRHVGAAVEDALAAFCGTRGPAPVARVTWMFGGFGRFISTTLLIWPTRCLNWTSTLMT